MHVTARNTLAPRDAYLQVKHAPVVLEEAEQKVAGIVHPQLRLALLLQQRHRHAAQ